MNRSLLSPNEILAAKAFGKQAAVFDSVYLDDTIIQYKRGRVRAHVNKYISPRSRILELNAGTGEDAVFFAGMGHRVHATDISRGMLHVLENKVRDKKMTDSITHEQCSFTSLECLMDKGPYDHIFSNFAGLNCTHHLDKVLASFAPLLKKDGTVTLVILPGFCLWEFLLLFKGKFRTAFRRWTGKKGAASRVEGEYFTCWYYNPSYVTGHLKNDFELLNIEGLCTLVPPSYLVGFAEKYPRVYRFLLNAENKLKSTWPWRIIGDYYIISLRKK
jgi:ubiquinone/menaquinone biosynthesis C-methylase UbiE